MSHAWSYDCVTILTAPANYSRRGASWIDSRDWRKRSSQVTCRDMDDVISSHAGDSVPGPGSAAHLVHCARCRSLTKLLHEVAAGDGLRPSEKQLRRIQTNIAAGLKPVRPLPLSRIFLFAFAIIFLLV